MKNQLIGRLEMSEAQTKSSRFTKSDLLLGWGLTLWSLLTESCEPPGFWVGRILIAVVFGRGSLPPWVRFGVCPASSGLSLGCLAIKTCQISLTGDCNSHLCFPIRKPHYLVCPDLQASVTCESKAVTATKIRPPCPFQPTATRLRGVKLQIL